MGSHSDLGPRLSAWPRLASLLPGRMEEPLNTSGFILTRLCVPTGVSPPWVGVVGAAGLDGEKEGGKFPSQETVRLASRYVGGTAPWL